MLRNRKLGVETLQVGDSYIAALTAKTGNNTLVLLLGDLNQRSITRKC